MAEFLTTVGTSYQIENIIKSSKEFLILVSPYLKINDVLLERLVDTDSRGVSITIIYGKGNLLDRERKKLDKLNNLNIYFASNLHAKCYCNEENAIISSMNLYEFSERNNREMSILINSRRERKIYKEIIEEIESIKNNSLVEQEYIKKQDDIEQAELSFKERRKIFLSEIYNSLSVKYPNYNITKNDEELKIYNFPFYGIELTLSFILTFDFNKSIRELRRIRNELRDSLLPRLDDYRCYWNGNQYNIRIYPAKDFDVEVEGRKLINSIDYYNNALEITKEFIIEHKSYFK